MTFDYKMKFIVIAESTCYAASSDNVLLNNGLECANGNFVASWDGCIDQGSLRVRCPKDFIPCNDLARNEQEFTCRYDCTDHGGRRDCLKEGILMLGV